MRETPIDPIFAVAGMRKSLRQQTELPCTLVSHYWDKAVPHYITQISPTGAWIDTLLPLHPGAEVVICFTPPGGAPTEVMLFGSVTRVVTGRRRQDRAPLGMAVEFTNVTADEQAVIQGALAA